MQDPKGNTIIGMYNTVDKSIDFEFTVDLNDLRITPVMTSQIQMTTLLNSTMTNGRRICVNNGVTWFDTDLPNCFGNTLKVNDTVERLLYTSQSDGSTFWKYELQNGNIDTFSIPSAFSTASRACTPVDAFTLTKNTPIAFDYDGNNNVYNFSQSEVVTNSGWSDNA